MTANEADEEDEVDENMPSTSHHTQHHSTSHIKRLRKGCMLLKNSESHTTDDSIDDSDGSGITTMTSMTGTATGTIGGDKKTDSLTAKRQQFRNYHRNKHVQHHTHARYKTNVTQTKDHPHVASGLKLAQSQAMAVAGFLPVDSSTEKQPNEPNRIHTNKSYSCSNSNKQQKASKSHEFHSVGSESMAGTDTTSLDAATDAQSLHTISSINRPVL